MNILVIPSWYISKNIPNNGSFFREQALSLQKCGNNIVILNGTFVSRYDYLDSDNFKFNIKYDDGMKVYSYVTPSFGIARHKKIYNNIFYRRIEKMYKRVISDGSKIDIIHAHSFIPAGYCACRLGKKYNIPVVITEHASRILNKDLVYYEKKCLEKCVQESSAFISVSEALKTSIRELTGTKKRIIVIPNMVSSIFSYKEANRKDSNFIFFTLGNLVKGKRFDLTINAFTKAFKGKDNIKLYIGGTGPLADSLAKLIKEKGMNQQIKLLGVLSREETARRMNECDIFVLASDYETFGVVYIEALACGKPIIGTRNGGADEIIKENNGIIVNTNDVEQLTNAMLKLYNSYSDYNNREIALSCQKNYGESNHIKQLLSLYNSILYDNNYIV